MNSGLFKRLSTNYLITGHIYLIYVVPSISFQTFLYRHLKLYRLLKIQYFIAIYRMR